jgi:hypothetical protein
MARETAVFDRATLVMSTILESLRILAFLGFPLLARLRSSRDASHTQHLTTLELLGFLEI